MLNKKRRKKGFTHNAHMFGVESNITHRTVKMI